MGGDAWIAGVVLCVMALLSGPLLMTTSQPPPCQCQSFAPSAQQTKSNDTVGNDHEVPAFPLPNDVQHFEGHSIPMDGPPLGGYDFGKCSKTVHKRAGETFPSPPRGEAARSSPSEPNRPRCVTFPRPPGYDADRAAVLKTLATRNLTVSVWYFAGRARFLGMTSRYLISLLKRKGGVVNKIVVFHQAWQVHVRRILTDMFPDATEFEYVLRRDLNDIYRHPHPNQLVIKVDDDVVFIDSTGPVYMLKEALDPDSTCAVLSGNVINHAGLAPVHQYIGAVDLPFSAYYNGTGKMIPNNTNSYQSIGTFVYPLEWSLTHWHFLNHITRGSAQSAYSFDPKQAPLDKFDFQCDGEVRRWGLNYVLANVSRDDLVRMDSLRRSGLNLGMDEQYMSAVKIRDLREAQGKTHRRSRACAIGPALAVHYMYTYQLKSLRLWKNVPRDKAKDPNALHPALLSVYDELSMVYNGEKECCEASDAAANATACSLLHLDEAALLKGFAVPMPDMSARLQKYAKEGEPLSDAQKKRHDASKKESVYKNWKLIG